MPDKNNVSDKDDEIIDNNKSNSSKKRKLLVYKYFTFKKSTSRWYCNYCS
jgi:hypothetical protein